MPDNQNAPAGGGASELWRVGQHYRIHVYQGDRPVATFHREEDAARAVADRKRADLATRQRDELRAALEEARLQIEYLHGKFQSTGSGETTLARLRTVLDRLREQGVGGVVSHETRSALRNAACVSSAEHKAASPPSPPEVDEEMVERALDATSTYLRSIGESGSWRDDGPAEQAVARGLMRTALEAVLSSASLSHHPVAQKPSPTYRAVKNAARRANSKLNSLKTMVRKKAAEQQAALSSASLAPQEAQTDGESVLAEIAAERRRQAEAEGWSPAHDDEHAKGEMAEAAACYARWAGKGAPIVVGDVRSGLGKPLDWPWHASWWKPTTARRDLIKAAALIVAEIERLDRADGRFVPATPFSTGEG